jgi:hypothetical protein
VLVSDDERLSRFIVKRRWLSGSAISADAFIPPKDGMLSVNCTGGLSDQTIWALGEQVRQARRDADGLHGRADALAGLIMSLGHTIDRDDEPPTHATISNWPSNRGEIRERALHFRSIFYACSLVVESVQHRQSPNRPC